MHGVLKNMDISFKRFVGLTLPACDQFAKHDFLLIDNQAGEIDFCLFVKQPHALGRINHHNRFLNAVQNQMVQAADTAICQLMAAGGLCSLLQITGGKRCQHCHQIACADQHQRIRH